MIIKTHLFIALFVAFLVNVRAEQRVVVINASQPSWEIHDIPYPNLSSVNHLLNQGWKIVSTSVAGTGGQSRAKSTFTYLFVLEAPLGVPKAIDLSKPEPDYAAIWKEAYQAARNRGGHVEQAAREAHEAVRAARGE